MAVTSGLLSVEEALGPVFSNQVWSSIWLAIDWPRLRDILGGYR